MSFYVHLCDIVYRLKLGLLYKSSNVMLLYLKWYKILAIDFFFIYLYCIKEGELFYLKLYYFFFLFKKSNCIYKFKVEI